ncbi:MAG: polysaccharide deacetylase family protein [Pseudomonadota bacterium]
MTTRVFMNRDFFARPSRTMARTMSLAMGALAISLTLGGSIGAAHACNNPQALGVSRTIEVDTTAGPGFGFQHYRDYDFLQPGEVVLTFDDGPLPGKTTAVLDALKKHCTKAMFFSVGKLAVGYPHILRRAAAEGHTIGTHTWSHKNLSRMSRDQLVDQIERGASAVRLAIGDKAAPFFRFPFLKDSETAIKYLSGRDQGIFSTDLDSFDFKERKPAALIKRVMANLKKKGKGIILFHDIQPVTAKAMDAFFTRLKEGGYKVVHLTAKAPLKTLPAFDEKIKKLFRGRARMAGGRPLSAVMRTVTPAAAQPDAAADAPQTTAAPAN